MCKLQFSNDLAPWNQQPHNFIPSGKGRFCMESLSVEALYGGITCHSKLATWELRVQKHIHNVTELVDLIDGVSSP